MTAPASRHAVPPAPTTDRPARTRTATRSVAGVLAAGAAAALLAGCGSSGGGSDDTSGSGSGVVPTDAAIVATIDLRRGEGDPLGKLHTLAKRIPAEGLVDSKVSAESIVQALTSGDERHLTWAKDVKPWLGDTAGGALWLKSGLTSKTKVPVDGIIWLESTDDTKAAKAIEKADGTGTVSKVDGKTVHHDKDDAYWAVFDGHVVVAPTKAAMAKSIKASGGDAFEGSGEWKSLAKFHVTGDPALTLRFTRAFGDDLGKAGKHYADSSSSTKQERQVGKQLQDAAKQLDELHGVGVGIGANDDTLFLDVRSRSEHDSGSGDPKGGSAKHRLGDLPATTLAGAAGSVDVGKAVDQVEQQDISARLDDALDQLDTGTLTPQQQAMVGDVKQLVKGLVAKDSLDTIKDAYGDGISAALVADDTGRIALTAQTDLKDEGKARAYEAKNVQAVGAVIGKYAKGITLTAEPGDGSVVNYVLAGLPVQQLLATTTPAQFTIAGKVVGSETIADLKAGKVVVATDVKDGRERLSLPKWGLTALDSSDHLEGTDRFDKDLKTAKVPSDADYASWVDIQGFVNYALSFVPKGQAQAAGLVTVQTRGLGGIVAYAVRGTDGDLHTRDDVVQLPVYES